MGQFDARARAMFHRNRAGKAPNSAQGPDSKFLLQQEQLRRRTPQPPPARGMKALFKRLLPPTTFTSKAVAIPAPTEPQITPSALPVEKKRPEIKAALQTNKIVFVRGATGSGKSTITPRIALEVLNEEGGFGSVAHNVPRRILASELGGYTSALMGEPVAGGLVGWAHSLRQQISPHSRIKFFTNGVYLMQRLTRRESPRGVKILDEFHVGALDQDLLYALHQKDLFEGRPVPRLAILSATMDAEKIRKNLPTRETRESSPIIDCEGRLFPIIQREPGQSCAADAVQFARRGKGVIVFLYGVKAIEECEDQINDILLKEPHSTPIQILHLHSQLTPEEQARAFTLYDGPKIILATDAGEVGVTIPGIQAVVCSGLCRAPSFDPHDGSLSLNVGPTSQRSIWQQVGRAGRTEPGEAVIHVKNIDSLPLDPDREITQVPLEDWVLRLEVHREPIEDLMAYLPDPPTWRQVNWANERLRALGLLSSVGEPTPLGKRVAKLPLGVHSGKLVSLAHDKEREGIRILARAIDIAAVQEAQGISSGKDDEWKAHCHAGHGSDVLAQVEALYNAPRAIWRETLRRVEEQLQTEGFNFTPDVQKAIKTLMESGDLTMLVGRPEMLSSERRRGYENISGTLRDKQKDAFFSVFNHATKAFNDSCNVKLSQMGLSVTGIHRAIDIRENLRRRLNVSDNTPVTKISGPEREHLQHCIWSSNVDQIFRRVREEDGTVYYESIYGGYQRQITKGSVVVNAPFVVGRPINIGNYDSDTGKQETDYLLSMVSLVPRKWLKDGHANLPGRHEVRDALANTPDALPPRKRKPQRDKQFFRPDGHQGRRGSGRY